MIIAAHSPHLVELGGNSIVFWLKLLCKFKVRDCVLVSTEYQSLVGQGHELPNTLVQVIAVLRPVKQSADASDENSITTEQKRVLIALRCHMGHNEAAVVGRVTRCFHAADT